MNEDNTLLHLSTWLIREDFSSKHSENLLVLVVNILNFFLSDEVRLLIGGEVQKFCFKTFTAALLACDVAVLLGGGGGGTDTLLPLVRTL